VRRRTEAKVADIEAKIRDLQRMRQALLNLTASCRGDGPMNGCAILEALDRAGESEIPETKGREKARSGDATATARR
jgi:hypothetical protein